MLDCFDVFSKLQNAPTKNLIGVPLKSLRRFANKITLDQSTGCLNWIGFKLRGYGMMTCRSVQFAPILAHVFSYRMSVGPVPEGWHVHHDCNNPSCVNPDHLVAVAPSAHSKITRERNPPPPCCPHGHEFTPENTSIVNGWRNCRECDRISNSARYAAWRAANPLSEKTHCIHGHPLSGENLYLYKTKTGVGRGCKICRHATTTRQRSINREKINARRRELRAQRNAA